MVISCIFSIKILNIIKTQKHFWSCHYAFFYPYINSRVFACNVSFIIYYLFIYYLFFIYLLFIYSVFIIYLLFNIFSQCWHRNIVLAATGWERTSACVFSLFQLAFGATRAEPAATIWHLTDDEAVGQLITHTHLRKRAKWSEKCDNVVSLMICYSYQL